MKTETLLARLTVLAIDRNNILDVEKATIAELAHICEHDVQYMYNQCNAKSDTEECVYCPNCKLHMHVAKHTAKKQQPRIPMRFSKNG